MILDKDFKSKLEAMGVIHDVYKAMDGDDLADVVRAATRALKKTDVIPLPQVEKKSTAISNQLREHGNVHFVNGEHKQAILCYIKALAYAPNNSLEMQMAYGNISAEMLAIKAYQPCQMNIKACLDKNCPQFLRDKLNKRYNETYKYINDEMMRDFMLRSDKILSDYIKFDVKRNPDVPFASEDVEFKNDGSKKVVAAKDIKSGTIVAKERAFVSVQDKKHQYTSCYYCHRIGLFFIPCGGCHALFCTTDCRNTCMKVYHRIECQIVDYLEWDGSRNDGVVNKLMTRAAIKMSLELGWDELSVASLEIGEKRLKKSSVKEAFDAGNPVSMLSYDDQKEFVHGKIFNGSFICAAVVHCLSQIPNYFPEDESKREKAIDAISRIMLHLYATFTNRIEILCSAYDYQKETFKCGVQRNIGWFSLTSKLTHSCEPNLFVLGLNDHVALVALQPIKKGEELTISYVIPCRDCDEVLPNKNALYRHRKKEHSDATMQEPTETGNINNLGESSMCGRCPRRYRARTEKHPQHVAVIEIHGVNPSPEEVMNIIHSKNISDDRVVEINLMTFLKGTRNIVPNCGRALAMLSNVPKTKISCVRGTQNNILNPIEEYTTRRQNIPSIVRRPAILQRSENIAHAQLLHGGQNIRDLNVQLLLEDGVIVNTNQIVLDMNDSTLLE